MIWFYIKDRAQWFHRTFHGSEVIFWSRLQLALGAIWYVASTSDVSPFFSNPKHLALWTMGNAMLTEYLRRRNTVIIGSHLMPKDYDHKDGDRQEEHHDA